jgi:hypothetical protein
MKRFYIYYVYDEDNVLRYVGKGTGNRYKGGIKDSTNNIIIKKLKNTEYRTVIQFNNLTEGEAVEKEKEIIRDVGRVVTNTGTLYNITEGGEGASGVIYTIEEIKRRYKNRLDFNLKNLNDNTLHHFVSLGDAALKLNTSRSLVNSLLKGKSTTILKGVWVLPNYDPSIPHFNSKSIELYDHNQNIILKFSSQREAADHLKCGVTLITSLKNRHINSIFQRYTLPGVINTKLRGKHVRSSSVLALRYKPVTIYDNDLKKYIKFESRKEMAKFYNIHSGDIKHLIDGRFKALLRGRITVVPIV